MTSIDTLILQEPNPFDPVTFVAKNFWTESQNCQITVDSIHQEIIPIVAKIIEQISQDQRSRSLLLEGDSGSGKSYLLGRLKKQLNAQAFFVYIPACPENDHIWRHTLRYTIDSLLYQPEGKKESQLVLWLKSLPIFKKGFLKKILGEKRIFIRHFLATYPSGIYEGEQFFRILYELTQPENFIWACNWLRGDQISEEQLKILGVSDLIEDEEFARGILANIGRIAEATKPIVLCFDQIENAPKRADGKRDLSSIFQVNTSFYINNLKNFLIILTVISDSWRHNKITVTPSDLDRIQQTLCLRKINLEQAAALWEYRLAHLHNQASPKPSSSLYPLSRKDLEKNYPGGQTNVRDVLNYGGKIYSKFKENGESSENKLESFKRLWQKELQENQEKISRISHISPPELIDMLIKALAVFQVQGIRKKLLHSPTYSSHSFSYIHPQTKKRIGIFWNESANMKSFVNAMKACLTIVEISACDCLYLIRAEKLTNKKTKGYKIYQQIFHSDSSPHQQLIPTLDDIHCLKTYHKLANDALYKDLVVNFEPTDLGTLQSLVREAKVLESCQLLQLLGTISQPLKPTVPEKVKPPIPNPDIEKYLLTLISSQKILGYKTLIKTMQQQLPQETEENIEKIFAKVCKSSSVTVLNPDEIPEQWVVCYNP